MFVALKTCLSFVYSAVFHLLSEGTTTNGDYLLPFKTGAFLARAPLQPVILRYPYRRFSPAWDSMDGVSINYRLAFNGSIGTCKQAQVCMSNMLEPSMQILYGLLIIAKRKSSILSHVGSCSDYFFSNFLHPYFPCSAKYHLPCC